MAGLAADSRHYARLQGRVEGLRGKLQEVDDKLGRLLAVFEESETVPERLKHRCSELDGMRTGLRLDILRIEDEMEELGGSAAEPAEVAEFLRALTTEIRALPLPERKTKIASVVTRVVVNRLDPSDGVDEGPPRCDGAHVRTRAISVDIQMRSRPAESVDSASLRADRVNRTGGGSDLGLAGSPARTTARTSSSDQHFPFRRAASNTFPRPRNAS